MNNNENPMELNDSELSEVNGGFSLGNKHPDKDKKKKKTSGSTKKSTAAEGTGILGTSVRLR